mgnify:CR=1 FL=1
MAKKAKAGINQIHMQNAIKTLAANIRFASVDDPIRSIAVTSSVPNEGKTTITIQLAQAMASSGKTVLIVECDMRRRSLANALGLHARTGIYSVLCGQAEIRDAVVSTLTRGMYFLDSEPHIPNPDVLLNSKRFHRFVEQALGNFDYVIFDTPPLSAFVDAAVLSTVVDGVLLVVGQNVVRRDELTKSYEQLKKADANIIGAVMNLCESEKNEYYTKYYTRGNSSDADAPAAPPPLPPRLLAPPRRLSRWPPCPGLRARTAPASNLKPIPSASGAKIAPDTTAQFIASMTRSSNKQ